MKNFVELCNDLEMIPLDKIINILDHKNEFDKISMLLGFISNQNTTIRENLNFVSEYIEILDLILLNIKINSLKRRKETLEKESKIVKTYKNSRDLYAISDLLKKIKKSIEDNRKKASYLEKDYSLQKNQIDLIKRNLSNYNLEIDKLNSQMKNCFAHINQISRLTETSSESSQIEALNSLGINMNLPNSEKIRMLQLKAKEISYEINQMKSKKEDLNTKLNKLYPKYESYKKDYDKVLSSVERDDKRTKELQSELKHKLRELDGNLVEEEIRNLNILRPLNQIEEDIKEMDAQLTEIIKSKQLIEPKKEEDPLYIKEKIERLSNEISKRASKLTINEKKTAFMEALNSYRKFELRLNEIERIINYFLSEIKLLSRFNIMVNGTSTDFLISILFQRDNNEQITLMGLTTPEKVFFIVALYLSLSITLNVNYIIFSNLFIPDDYNKSGSILRAFRKIVPVFKKIEPLSKFNLILLLSNIEIKKEIEYTKIFEIKES